MSCSVRKSEEFSHAWAVFLWCKVILQDNSGNYHAYLKAKERGCRFVEVVGGGRHARAGRVGVGVLVVWLFNPSLNSESAEVFTVRQMCAC